MGEDDREVATLSELQEPGIRQTGLIHIDDEDPGVYGKEGLRYHSRKHKNYAVSIHGEFHKALQTELEASARRAMGYGD